MKYQNLHKKGWDATDLHKLNSSLSSYEIKDKSGSKKELNKLVYWMSLLIIAVCNLGISLFLVPFLIVFGITFSSVIVIALGFMFGILFSFLIKDIEHLEPKHHLFAAIFIPMIALINIFLMVQGANFFANIFKTDIQQDPVLLSFFYIGAFLLPYAWVYFQGRKE